MVAITKKTKEAELTLKVTPAQILKMIEQLPNEEIVKLHNKIQGLIDKMEDVDMDEVYGINRVEQDKFNKKPILFTKEKRRALEKEWEKNPEKEVEMTEEEMDEAIRNI